MKFNSFAFIFLSPGFSPEKNTITTQKGDYRFKAVGIDMANKEQALQVAEELANDGYQMIELCGGFGAEWAYKISERLENKIPVGGVLYGPQFRQSLADLMRIERTSAQQSNEVSKRPQMKFSSFAYIFLSPDSSIIW